MLATFRAARLGVAAVAVLATSLAFAHPKLLSTNPADRSASAAPTLIELHFSEKLVAQFSDATLTMTGAPGNGPTKIAAKASTTADGKALTLSPAQPLTPGAYRVEWHAVAADTHRVSGNFAFQVK